MGHAEHPISVSWREAKSVLSGSPAIAAQKVIGPCDGRWPLSTCIKGEREEERGGREGGGKETDLKVTVL